MNFAETRAHSVLVTIDTRLADVEVQNALVEFDNMVGPTLGKTQPLYSPEFSPKRA